MAKPSFRQFDYRLRPNKSAERKMICEALQRLSFFDSVNNYRYVGFGSTTFVDFSLFHKVLNISDMISIEGEKRYENRVNFNKTFDCIKIKMGNSNTIIPQLSWDKKTIIWLDYDGRLLDSVLEDIAYISANVISGSILIVTVHAGTYQREGPLGSDKEIENYRIKKFKEDVGSDKVPGDIVGKQLEGVEMGKTCRRVIHNEIQQVLRDTNGLRSPEQRMQYKPLFHFSYKDGARMLTLGGVFCETKDEALFNQCHFENLEYVTPGGEPYKINIPVITPRERHFLNKRLPHGTTKEAVKIGLTEAEIENYNRLYRYYPDYAEIELT